MKIPVEFIQIYRALIFSINARIRLSESLESQTFHSISDQILSSNRCISGVT